MGEDAERTATTEAIWPSDRATAKGVPAKLRVNYGRSQVTLSWLFTEQGCEDVLVLIKNLAHIMRQSLIHRASKIEAANLDQELDLLLRGGEEEVDSDE